MFVELKNLMTDEIMAMSNNNVIRVGRDERNHFKCHYRIFSS